MFSVTYELSHIVFIFDFVSSVATTFNKGCKEYETQLKHHVGKQLEPLAKDIRDTVAKMSTLQSAKDARPPLDKTLREMEVRLLATMKDLVAQEVRQALALHSANLTRSLSATPIIAASQLSVPPPVPTYQDIQVLFISKSFLARLSLPCFPTYIDRVRLTNQLAKILQVIIPFILRNWQPCSKVLVIKNKQSNFFANFYSFLVLKDTCFFAESTLPGTHRRDVNL